MSETGVGFQHAFQPSSCPPLFAVPARQTRGTIPVHTAAAGFARARAHTHTHSTVQNDAPPRRTHHLAALRQNTSSGMPRPRPKRAPFATGDGPLQRHRNASLSRPERVHSRHSSPKDAPFGTGASPLQRHWNVFIQRPCSFQPFLPRRCSVWDGSQPASETLECLHSETLFIPGTPPPKMLRLGREPARARLQRHSSVPEDSLDGTPILSSETLQRPRR